MMRWKLTAGFALVAAALVPSSAAHAQLEGRWLVLPVLEDVEHSDRVREIATAAEGALTARGITLASVEDLDSLGSRPSEIPADLRSSLAAAVTQGVEDAAYGRPRALEEIPPLLERAEGYLDALGSEQETARAVTDLLLILARMYEDRRDAGAARAAIERALRLIPDPMLTPAHHPDEPVALLGRAREELRSGAGVPLEIVTDGSGCQAYLNGQLVGPTPHVTHRYPGEYAVRVRCEQRWSRVHRITLERATRLTIPVSLEDAVRLTPRLHLAYANANTARRAHEDARTLATRVGAEGTLLLRFRGAGAEVELVPERGPIMRAALPTERDPAALEQTWARLLDGERAAPQQSTVTFGIEEWAYWYIGFTFVAGAVAELAVGTLIEAEVWETRPLVMTPAENRALPFILGGVFALAATAWFIWMPIVPDNPSSQASTTVRFAIGLGTAGLEVTF